MNVCVIGDVSFNTIIHLNDFPQSNGTFFAQDTYQSIGSSAAGKAINLSLLGHEVTLISRLGADEYQEKIISFFHQFNINTQWIMDSSKTMTHTNIMTKDGKRTSIFTQMLDGPKENYFSALLEKLKDYDHIFLELSASFQPYVSFLKSYPIWVDLHDYDGKNPFMDPYLSVADFVAFSLENPDDLTPILTKVGSTPVLFTEGKEGATYKKEDKLVHTESLTGARIVDTNGAGDAFISAFYTYYHEGYNIEEAMNKAHAYAFKVIHSKTLYPN